MLCGSPSFVFNSCIANSLVPSLQHNKFLTFSRLDDGPTDVVLQTSKNFLEPSQLSYYNDMVEIAGDVALHAAYVDWVFDMKAQLRSDSRYVIVSGDDGRNTMFPSPRWQPDLDTDDTIVDRLAEIDCSEGGSPSGRGLIRVANMAFRSERTVIMRKLVELERAGCDIEIIATNADGDIISGLVSAGIPVHMLFLRAAGTRPQVIVHSKFWLVDARSRVTGARTRYTYAGSSNWRADQQYSDDLLLRIDNDAVYAAYTSYWELIRTRVASDQNRPATETVAPASALGATPRASAAGWNGSDVTARVAASDGHNQASVGLAPARRDGGRADRDVGLPGRERRLQRAGAPGLGRRRDDHHLLRRGRRRQPRAGPHARGAHRQARPGARGPAAQVRAVAARSPPGARGDPDRHGPSARAWRTSP